RRLVIATAQRRKDPRQADAVQHALLDLGAGQDLDLGRQHLVGFWHRAAGGVAGIGLVDIFLTEPHQEARLGGVEGFQRKGEGQAQRQYDQEDTQHQEALAPEQGHEIAGLIARPGAQLRRSAEWRCRLATWRPSAFRHENPKTKAWDRPSPRAINAWLPISVNHRLEGCFSRWKPRCPCRSPFASPSSAWPWAPGPARAAARTCSPRLRGRAPTSPISAMRPGPTPSRPTGSIRATRSIWLSPPPRN